MIYRFKDDDEDTNKISPKVGILISLLLLQAESIFNSYQP
jgi:hypothetical protein